jgi:pimeloyl-ACP methyl ester carboxylesterase
MRLTNQQPRGRQRLLNTMLALAMAGSFILSSITPAYAKGDQHSVAKPTIVLVHGAFADSSSWRYVASKLTDEGYPVLAPANPLRGIAEDSAYLSSVLATIDGPVVLVGHSYGGAVITNAATGNANVKALVFIAAFALDSEESLAAISARFPNSDLGSSLLPRPYPLADGTTGTDLYIQPAKFRDVFARDLSVGTTTTMAQTQRPLSGAAFTAQSSTPAWKTIPSWYMVATKDRAIDPEAERFMAQRAGSHTVEVKASHAVSLSRPGAVVSLITEAAST